VREPEGRNVDHGANHRVRRVWQYRAGTKFQRKVPRK
jgi:hypothetical protein